MPAACCLFRSSLAYRRDAFCTGLERLGFTIEARPRAAPKPGDLLLIWNRRGMEDQAAGRYERHGAIVVVAENGYIWPTGAEKVYALALSQHNGAGRWQEGGPERWEGFGIEVKPWRERGDRVVVLPQRGIGPHGVAMPYTWLRETLGLLQKTRHPLHIRHHPGDKSEPYEALNGAHCAVTWGSGAAIKALVAGVPVFHTFPRWIGAPASTFGLADLEATRCDDAARLAMLRRLAWAQWGLEEVRTGEAYAWLLNR